MTPPSASRFTIPAYWTPEQTLAVVELLDDLRQLIWVHYGMPLIDEVREQHRPGSDRRPDRTRP